MARIIVDSYMVRYPLGGMMSWVMQYVVGLHRLGHEVFFVERCTHEDECYDPVRMRMSDDCREGVRALSQALEPFGLGARWCFADIHGTYFGLGRQALRDAFGSADVFLDLGPHGAWAQEAASVPVRVMIDGEPGFTQMRWETARAAGREPPEYDHYYTTGQNIGTEHSACPTVGLSWQHVFHPVVTDLFDNHGTREGAAFTTVMNWVSHDTVVYEGKSYYQKDREFEKFVDLPAMVAAPLEISLCRAPDDVRRRLAASGWRLKSGQDSTLSIERFHTHIRESRGEFSVCKHVFVATNTGWFSDRSAAYLASGRPVVLQDTGFSSHLPCGDGLLAIRTPEEAAAAIESIQSSYKRHSDAAREIAEQHLDSRVVLGRLLAEIGI